jgi:hypothetical protein
VLGADKGTVRISNSGAPVRKNPSLTTTVLVGYYAGPLKTNAVRIAPVVNSFTLNKYAGKNTELISTCLLEVRIFSGPYLEKEAKHLCFLVTLADCKWCVNCR